MSIIEPEHNKRTGTYDADKTQKAKAGAIRDIVTSQTELMIRNSVKTDLNDTAAVEHVAREFMELCAKYGILPSIELFAAQLGVNRRWIYQYLAEHPEHPTVQLIDRLRTLWAGLRIAASDRHAADPTTSIFVLLNSGLNFTNEHKVEIAETSRNPYSDGRTVEEIREYYAAMVGEDE